MANALRFRGEYLILFALLLVGPRFSSTAENAKPYTGKGLAPSYLRCEYLADPLGIDEPAPRLSWIVESGERDQRQTAYRILVSTNEQALKRDRGDLWDTGKVASDDSICAVYHGPTLVSHQHCFWKVKVWDRDGRESAWSRPARWSMGLLQANDWKADWIGCDALRQRTFPEASLGGAKWIWHRADDPGNVPKCERLFYATFEVPAGATVKHAELYGSADDAMKFVINNGHVVTTQPVNDSWRQATKTDVTARVKPGHNSIRVLVENARAGSAGLIARLVILLEDGKTVTVVTDDSWKSTDSADTKGDDWIKAKIDASAWPAVGVVGDYGVKPWGQLKLADTFLPPATFFRKEFRADKPIARATLYATALGLVEMRLNGKPVSDDFFTPGWTDYRKRVYYRTWDVTKIVKRGDNAMGAIIADGWFTGYVGYRGSRDTYGQATRVRAQLRLEFEDGTVMDVGTSSSWKASTGPIVEADFLRGEAYDARLEMPGWDVAGFKDANWRSAAAGCDEVHPATQAHPGPPVRSLPEFKAIAITEPKPGVFVLNLGQNFAGIPRLKVSGKAGQKITLRFAERLSPDGTLYTVNLRTARATDTYICKGQGTEIWEPRFTFHGFQYVEITGLEGKPSRDTVVGIPLSSDTPVVGAFSCSDRMLNQLHNNIYWTQRANFLDIPTDCPQRDERLGWTGDAQVYVRTATLNTDVEAFFTKWLVDLDDAQRDDGQYPRVAPTVVTDPDGGPAWADAGVICPWTLYQVYGDRRILERHYLAMKHFIEFCRDRSTPDFLPPPKFHCYGDWLSIQADTPKDVIYTAYFAHSAQLTGEAAAALGEKSEARQFQKLFESIRGAFVRTYVAPDGRIKGDTQAGYVLALAFDLVQGEQGKLAAKYLVEDIEKRGWHLSTGFIGTKDLMLVLSKIGRPDVAYRLLFNDTFPSWGFSIKQGATSIWERWDGWTPEKGFQDAGMNSFAHYSFGAVYQWMVENIGGIRSAAPSYKEILIKPELSDKLSTATVEYRSIHGLIETDWKREKDKLHFNVTIPANTIAQVVLPATSEEGLQESGGTLTKAAGVKSVKMDGTNVVVSVGSGKYAFTAPMTR